MRRLGGSNRAGAVISLVGETAWRDACSPAVSRVTSELRVDLEVVTVSKSRICPELTGREELDMIQVGRFRILQIDLASGDDWRRAGLRLARARRRKLKQEREHYALQVQASRHRLRGGRHSVVGTFGCVRKCRLTTDYGSPCGTSRYRTEHQLGGEWNDGDLQPPQAAWVDRRLRRQLQTSDYSFSISNTTAKTQKVTYQGALVFKIPAEEAFDICVFNDGNYKLGLTSSPAAKLKTTVTM